MTRRVLSILTGRCTACGLRLRLHRDKHNRSLACEEAKARHRYASISNARLREVMLATIDEQRRGGKA